MASLLAMSRLSADLTKAAGSNYSSDVVQRSGASVTELPGLTPGGQTGADALKKDVPHGLDGRLRRPAAGGVRITMTQGPRNYAPRLNKKTA